MSDGGASFPDVPPFYYRVNFEMAVGLTFIWLNKNSFKLISVAQSDRKHLVFKMPT